MKAEYAPFDISDHLDSDETIAGYLTAAAEDEDPNVLLGALAHVAKARGMAQVAKAAGLGRESLYKTLAPGSHPRFETIQAILRALNVQIAVRRSVPAKTKRPPPSKVGKAAKETAAMRAAKKRKAAAQASVEKLAVNKRRA